MARLTPADNPVVLKEWKELEKSLLKIMPVYKVYHLTSETKVPLYKHDDKDEIIYCIKGSGFGVLEDKEVDLSVGKEFIVKAGTMHSLKSNENLYVCSFPIPVVDGN